MNTQLVIFDLDGTLIDSRADLAAGINHMRAQFGLAPLAVETIGGYVGDGVRKLVERSLQGAEVDLGEALEMNQDYYFSHLVVHTTLYPGVEEGIRKLADAGHKLALLSNKQGTSCRAILRHFGLDGFFCAIVGGGDVAHLKPEPDGVFLCLENAEIGASSTWMAGDHYTDLAVAKNAGVKSAFVRYGFGEERGYEPDLYFDSFSELASHFVGR